MVPEKVEASHTDLTEVTRMVLVEVGTVVVLTTGHTTTTGVLENEDRSSVLPISRIRLLSLLCRLWETTLTGSPHSGRSYLAVLANTSITGTDVAAVLREKSVKQCSQHVNCSRIQIRYCREGVGHTLRVLEKRVGIVG